MEPEIASTRSRFEAPIGPGDVSTSPPGVTIAIPNWNHELVLPRSISSALAGVSALARLGISAEVLVIDDGSRDGSLVLLRQAEALHCGDGLRVLAFARNAGLPAARNAGLIHATFRHILFMDADNALIPENVPLFYRAALETDAAAIHGTLIWQEDARMMGLNGRNATVTHDEGVQTRSFAERYVDAFALFDRVQVHDAGSYATVPEGDVRDDWELSLHLAVSGRRIVFVPVVFGVCHASLGQETAARHEAHTQYLHRIFNQPGLRDRLPLNTRPLRYRPDIGYL